MNNIILNSARYTFQEIVSRLQQPTYTSSQHLDEVVSLPRSRPVSSRCRKGMKCFDGVYNTWWCRRCLSLVKNHYEVAILYLFNLYHSFSVACSGIFRGAGWGANIFQLQKSLKICLFIQKCEYYILFSQIRIFAFQILGTRLYLLEFFAFLFSANLDLEWITSEGTSLKIKQRPLSGKSVDRLIQRLQVDAYVVLIL